MSPIEGPIGAINVQLDQTLHFIGTFPKNLYPLVYTENYSNYDKLNGCIYPDNTIKTIGNQNEVDHLMPNKTSLRILLINMNLFEASLQKIFGDTNIKRIYASVAYHVNDEDIEMYIDIHDRTLKNEKVSEEEVIRLLSKIYKEPIIDQLPLEQGYDLINKSISLMRHHLRDPFLIKDLCQRLGVTPRTLEKAFKKHLNISPKLYYKRLLLLSIESELRKTEESTISDVIGKFQIYALSQFGASFKNYFNKTPSEVLHLDIKNNPFGWNEEIFSEYAEA